MSNSLLGGVLIGLAAAALLLFNGRIAGISGIVGRIPVDPDRGWRLAFIMGLLLGGLGFALARPEAFAAEPVSPAILGLAGVFVGAGTQLANGCTSGHGVCGIGRLSKRSLVATVTFMLVAAAVVQVSR